MRQPATLPASKVEALRTAHQLAVDVFEKLLTADARAREVHAARVRLWETEQALRGAGARA